MIDQECMVRAITERLAKRGVRVNVAGTIARDDKGDLVFTNWDMTVLDSFRMRSTTGTFNVFAYEAMCAIGEPCSCGHPVSEHRAPDGIPEDSFLGSTFAGLPFPFVGTCQKPGCNCCKWWDESPPPPSEDR